MQYTQGNWTVQDSVSGTSNEAFQIQVNPGVRVHYARKGGNDGELVLTNITGSGLLAAPETVRYGKSAVADIYKGTDIPTGAQLPTKEGMRLLVEVKENLTASNSVSGTEVELPLKAWMVVQVPKSNIINGNAIHYAIQRLLSAICMGGDEEWDAVQRFFNIAHGDLDPSDAA